MKIKSRNTDIPAVSSGGAGKYTLNTTFEELQYIAALLYVTRLGGGTYKGAAFDLINTIEGLFDEDFLEQAATDVNFYVSIVGDDGITIMESYPYTEVCLEV